MAVVAGQNLKISDNSTEGTDGKVVLETTNPIKADELMILVEYPHVGGNSDTGFSLTLGSVFQFDLVNVTAEFQAGEDVSGAIDQITKTFGVGPYQRWVKIPWSLVGMKVFLHIQWTGAFTSLPDMKIHLLGNSVSY
jgi:hypothetical protein